MEEDRGLSLSPTVGQTYKNRNGCEYLCLGKDTAHGMIDYVVPGLVGLPNGRFRNMKSGWTLLCMRTERSSGGAVWMGDSSLWSSWYPVGNMA